MLYEVITNGAQINVNGFTGSTLDISEEDFIKGNYKFQGNSQNSILNLGTIKASNKSYVALLGKEIINRITSYNVCYTKLLRFRRSFSYFK